MKQRTGKPLILSEHGIYTKERKIDLFQAEWIRDNRGTLTPKIAPKSRIFAIYGFVSLRH
jgi:hypothetical protein